MASITTDTAGKGQRSGMTSAQGAALVAALVVLLHAGATALWGLAGLAMAALLMVPVIFVALLLITVGK